MKAQTATTQIYGSSAFGSFNPKSQVLKTTLNGFDFPESSTEPLKPPDFHTGEALVSTPPILQSLSPNHGGSKTFICVPASGCQTFVIPQTEMNGQNGDEFLSYVIERKGKEEKVEEEENRCSGSDEVSVGEVVRLQSALEKITQELKARDEEVVRLTRIREAGERELEDLTASLFQEAHKMVREANERAAASEKALTESQMKVDVLTAEVTALKTLVLTSTPSRPNPHLHPQIGSDPSPGVNLFSRRHRRSPSHFNLKYGRENSPPESPTQPELSVVDSISLAVDTPTEVDPVLHKDFVAWRENPRLDKEDPFIARIYSEDIDLCLLFNNRDLGSAVRQAVETRDIYIEAVSDKAKTVFPKKCALLEVSRQCHYRMKIGDKETWYSISQICRNRIIAVCDFINYLRYIQLGLVKSTELDIYWEIIRLRKEMVLARLGLPLSST